MHELSIATNIVEIAVEEAKKAQVQDFSEIVLEVGALSGIVEEALEFAMAEAVKGSPLRNAKRVLITIQGKARCNQCMQEFITPDHFTPCIECGYPYTDIVKGKDLIIKSLKY